MRSSRAALLTLLLISPMLASPAFAGDISAVVNGRSIHVGASEDWNEQNYGLGIEYQFASQSRWKTVVMANGFRDSDENMSYMVGAGLHRNLYATDLLRGFHIDVGINAFLMMREDVNDNRPFPGALPSVTIGNRYVGFNVTYLPRKAVERLYDSRVVDQSMSGIAYVQFKISVSELLASHR